MSRFSDVFLDEVRHKLPISSIVGEYVVWDKKKTQVRRGDYWACCPFHGEKTPSFHADDRKGIYHCFGCGVTGDVYRFLTEYANMSFPDAVEKAAVMAGIPMPKRDYSGETPQQHQDREAEIAQKRVEMEKRQAQLEQDREEQRAQRTQDAQEVWKSTVPLVGTQGEAYLVARGIAPISEWPWSPDDTIRFHPGLDHEKYQRDGVWPAVVCKVVDAFGDATAVWQIYLDRKKPAKAPLEYNKLGRGPAAGGAIRIGGDAPDIEISEGTETALAAWELHNYRRPSWSLMSSGMMTVWEAPSFVTRARTNPDGDRGKLTKDGKLLEPAGMMAAMTLHERLVATGITNPINATSRHGDSLDLLVARKLHENRLTGHLTP